MPAFQDPELLNPAVHCFARCFVCRKLMAITRDTSDKLVLTERKCPHCGAFNDDDQVIRSFALNLAHTAGITSSHKIQGLDLALIPFLITTGLVAFMGFPLWFVIPNLVIYAYPIVLTTRWLYRYWYKLRFLDEEYVEAVHGVRRSLLLWVFANILGWAFLSIRPPFLSLFS